MDDDSKTYFIHITNELATIKAMLSALLDAEKTRTAEAQQIPYDEAAQIVEKRVDAHQTRLLDHALTFLSRH